VRLPGPTAPAEFEHYLEGATQGIVYSCTGLDDEVERAIDAVRHARPNPPQELIDAAREAYRRYRARGHGQGQV
jgi:hypothetical protein